MNNKKIIPISKLSQIRKNIKNKEIVFTNGCFDILHYGHVKYLEAAKAKGDTLVVGLNSDSSVKKIKGKNRPINTQSDRAEILSALSSVDYVVIFNDLTPYNVIKTLKPDILVKGGDWKKKDIVGSDIVKKTLTIPYVKNRSTSNIIKKIIQLS